jgi:hypothetical protein
MRDEVLKLALEGAANYIDALGGDSRKYRQARSAPVQPVASLKEADVLMMAEAHGIDPSTKGLYGFYIDCISTTPPAAAPVQEPVAHCEAGPEFCPVCWAETRSLALAAAVGYIQRNTPPLVWTEICNALTTTPPAAERQWVGLTDDDLVELVKFSTEELGLYSLCLDVEAKLRSKNNG